MKVVIILITISAISFSTCAQKKIAEGTIKTKSVTFSAKKSKSGRNIEITNQSSRTDILAANKSAIKLSDVKYRPEQGISTNFKKVFTNQRLKELLPEVYLALNLYINGSGVIKSVQFIVKDGTLIMPSELELLEQYLKKNVSVVVPTGFAADERIFPITQLIRFQQLLDNTAVN